MSASQFVGVGSDADLALDDVALAGQGLLLLALLSCASRQRCGEAPPKTARRCTASANASTFDLRATFLIDAHILI